MLNGYSGCVLFIQISGKKGESGMVGAQGPPGPPGRQGAKGAKGEDGKLVIVSDRSLLHLWS